MGHHNANERFVLAVRQRLGRLEDGAGLAAFRISFGLLLAIDTARYLYKGWPIRYWVTPDFLFKFYGFEWVQPLPGWAIVALCWMLLAAGVTAALGLAYRTSMVVLWLGHTYLFLLAAERYLNHVYLICLLTFIMIWLPADRTFSLRRGQRRDFVPAWARIWLLAQVGLVYVYGGIAKIDGDWLDGAPMGRWLENSAERVPWAADVLLAGPTAAIVCWGGLLFDLLIVPALLWRRTRVAAVIVSFAFHLTNAIIFKIGIFPFVMLGATTLFLEPSWPRRLARGATRAVDAIPSGAAAPRAVVYAMASWFALQLALPLRHHFYPGDVAWTEEGHYFSWRMKLRSKRGKVTFIVTDPRTGVSEKVTGKDELSRTQARKMAGNPALIHQYALHLADEYEARWGVRPQVHVKAKASLNYGPRRRMIDPDVDLAAQSPSLAAATWILPYDRR